jgi:inorganic triphosphatase YgiF
MASEYELKLRAEPAQLERLERALRRRCEGDSQPEHLVRRYYDTPDRRLAEQHVSLRVREAGGRRTQTIKSDLARGQGYARGEWEIELGDRDLDLAATANPRVRALLQSDDTRDRLEEVCVTDLQRTRSICRLPNGTEVECAIDVGRVSAGTRHDPICEVELELRAGRCAELFRLARELHEQADLRLEPRSKGSRGRALLAPSGSPPRAARPRMDPAWTLERAFREVASSYIRQLRAHEAYLRETDHARGVHQMRVSARRLRSATAPLAEALPPTLTGPLSDELRWCAKRLAAARDWDVFIEETLAPLRESLPAEKSLRVLARHAVAARRRAYRRVHRTIDSGRYTRLLIDWGLWIESEDWGSLDERTDPAPLARPIREVASELLDAADAAIRSSGAGVRVHSPDDLHQLRLAVKRLRYATDALESLYPRERTRRHRSAPALLRRIRRRAEARADRRALRAAAKLVIGWQSASLASTRERLFKTWARFEGLERFWR